MPVTERERAYFQRLGAYKRESHARAAAQHRALPLAERLRASWRLFARHADAARAPRPDDQPSRFYDLARERGLYRP